MCEKELKKFITKYVYSTNEKLTPAGELLNLCKAYLNKKGNKFTNKCFSNIMKESNIKKERKRVNGKLMTVYHCYVNQDVINRFKNYINNKIQYIINNAEPIGNCYKLNTRIKAITHAVKELQKMGYLTKKRIRYSGKQITVYCLN